MLSYGATGLLFSLSYPGVPLLAPRLRLAERIRSVALLIRPAILLSTLDRPRRWPLRLEGGAGAAMMGTWASLRVAATGTGGGGGGGGMVFCWG
jgi:hypothetical protein